jgi:hypothetical protein
VAWPDSLIPLLLSELMWIIGSGSDITDEAALASAWLGLGSGSAWLKYGSGLGKFGSKIDMLKGTNPYLKLKNFQHESFKKMKYLQTHQRNLDFTERA